MRTCHEAGYSGFWIHDSSVQCLVVNPAHVPTKDKERTKKADRVDCRKLARRLRNGEIEGIYVPSRPKVEDRSLIRTRHGMVKKQTRCKNQIKFYSAILRDPRTGRIGKQSLVQTLHYLD